MAGARRLALPFLVLLAVHGPAGPVAAQEEGAGPVSPDSADALREEIERPPASHGLTTGDVLAAPVDLAFLPLRLVVGGVAHGVGLAVDLEIVSDALGLLRTVEKAGVHPSLTTGLGPRSGVAAGVRYDGLAPLYLETALSHRLARRHAVGLGTGPGRSRAFVEASYHRWGEPVVWGVGMDAPEAAGAEFELDRVEARAGGSLPLGRHAVRAELGWQRDHVALPAPSEALPGGSPSDASIAAARGRSRYATARVALVLDLLRRDTLRLSGARAELRADGFQGVGGTAGRFVRLEADVRGRLPLGGRHAAVLRVRAATTEAEAPSPSSTSRPSGPRTASGPTRTAVSATGLSSWCRASSTTRSGARCGSGGGPRASSSGTREGWRPPRVASTGHGAPGASDSP